MASSTESPNGTPKRIRNSKGNGKTNSPNTDPTQTTDTKPGHEPEPEREPDTTSNPTSEVQGIPRLLVVEPPPPNSEPKQKKQRPVGMKYNKAAKTLTKTGAAGAETVVMVQAIIQTLFMVGSGRVGAHWAITDEEAEAIATPAANIIAKYVDTDKFAKYSDPAALLMALGMVCVPRLIVTVTTKKKKEVKPVGPINTVKQTETSSGTDVGADSGSANRDSGNVVKANVEELLRAAEYKPY